MSRPRGAGPQAAVHCFTDAHQPSQSAHLGAQFLVRGRRCKSLRRRRRGASAGWPAAPARPARPRASSPSVPSRVRPAWPRGGRPPARDRPARASADSMSRGTSKTMAVPCAASAWRAVSARMSGCRMASRRCRAAGSAKGEFAHARAIERAAGIDKLRAELRGDRRDRCAAGCVRLRAIASVSTMLAPSAASAVATVLLPLPMPPVRMMRNGAGWVMVGSSGPAIQPSTRTGPASSTVAGAGQEGPKGT